MHSMMPTEDNDRYEQCLLYLENEEIETNHLYKLLSDDLDIIRAEVIDYLLDNPERLAEIYLRNMLPTRDDDWIVRGRVRLAWAKLKKYDLHNISKYGEINDDYDIVWHIAASCVQSQSQWYYDCLLSFSQSSDLTVVNLVEHLNTFISRGLDVVGTGQPEQD